MIIYAIDDEKNAREYLIDKVSKVCPDAQIFAYEDAKSALAAAKENPFDVAFMDINMPKVNGIELAKEFKKMNPKSNIIFVTGYSEYSLDAFALDASGYILKPVMVEDIEHALENLRYPLVVGGGIDITIQCFGNFEVYFKGQPLKFKYNKSKEVVAYLVDRRGAVCSNNEVIAALWDDNDNHNSYYRSLLKDIGDTFERIGCKDVIVRHRAGTSIVPNRVHCDYFDFLDGKPAGINAYNGDYMYQYSWAEETSSLLFIKSEFSEHMEYLE